jgi:plasmid stabilization system protein ParE
MKPIILKLARDDLMEIRQYLSQFGDSPPKKFRTSFEKFCIQVASMPYMYAQYDLNPKYRRAVIEYDYLVFYQVEEKNDRVNIYRVLHGKRDILPFLDADKDL